MLRDVARGTHELLEELIFCDGLEHLVIYFEMSCPAFVKLYIVHKILFSEFKVASVFYPSKVFCP